jgi:branched-chain amino acid transport system permease protein
LLGGVFALCGIGMSMIFGIVKLTNLAHGELLILAAYLSAVMTQHWGMNPLVTILIVAPIMFGAAI